MADADAILRLRSELAKGGLDAQNAATDLASLGHYDLDVVMTLSSMLMDSAGNVAYTAERLLRGVSLVDSVYPMLREDADAASFAAHVLFHRHQWDVEDPGALFESLHFLERDHFDSLVDYLSERPLPRAAFEALVDQLARDPMPDRWRRGPGDILAAFGPVLPPGILSRIASLLDGDDEWVRAKTVECLALIGPDARDAAPAIHRALRDGVPVVWHVPAALAAILGADAVPALADVVLDAGFDELTRKYAAKALGDIGAAAAGALPALQSALGIPVPDVRDAASRAIDTITAQAR